MEAAIREVLAAHGRLPVDAHTLGEEDDLAEAGLTSHALVNVMLALEEEFDLEFPESVLREKSTFQSIGSIADVIRDLTASQAAS